MENTKTKNAINSVINMVNGMPFIFNTEADIQGLVYSELLKEYTENYQTDLTDSQGEKYYTNRVHMEYFSGNGGRIDVIVFSEEEIRLIDTRWLCIKTKTSERPGYRPIKLQDAIEIKTVGGKGIEIKTVGGKGEGTLFTELKNDIERLSKLVKEKKTEIAHFLFIIRRPTKMEQIINAEQTARALCKKNGIQFYCNDYEKLFISKSFASQKR